jgi:hypothetical protein
MACSLKSNSCAAAWQAPKVFGGKAYGDRLDCHPVTHRQITEAKGVAGMGQIRPAQLHDGAGIGGTPVERPALLKVNSCAAAWNSTHHCE